jgi:predicted branched-subunit amino acid permease
MGLVSQSGWYTSLMKLVSNNLVIFLFITSFLSWVKWQIHCLMGLAFGSRCSSCSIDSLGTPGMLAGFHAKMSLFS